MVFSSDANGKEVGISTGCSSVIKITNPKLWWPYLMSENPGKMF